jgi:diguanylate cyclase (GGDEF)-like protein/PAS domain S-box-containing protein
VAKIESLCLKVLLVEDDDDDYFLFVELLDDIEGTAFDLTWVSNFEAALTQIRENVHDVCFCDYQLGARNGIDLLKEGMALGYSIPIIMLTGQDCREIDLEAMEAGAADYLVKGLITPALLDRSIRYAVNHSRTLAALREREEQYALVARAANDGLWDWNVQTQDVYFSARWKSMIGYAEQELTASMDEWLDRIHLEDRARFQTELHAHIQGQSPAFEIQYRIRHKDGLYRWVNSRGLAVWGQEGQMIRMAGSQTDLTHHVALYDQLTGLPSRALFLEQLKRALSRVKREPAYRFAVLFLDCDRFKVVNDSLGHLIGDQLLIGVAQRLERLLRPGDVIARLGGDEFAILLENMPTLSEVEKVAGRLNQDLEKPFVLEGHTVYTSVSIGIALNTETTLNPEDLLRDADNAMYRAKALGKSQYAIFENEMRDHVQSRFQVETDLRAALERHEFKLYYQPIVSLETGMLKGLEALIRWQHPQQGLISPVDFIPIAEETGLIIPIGDWVLNEACQQLQEWQKSFLGLEFLSVSVNLSRKQFSQANLASTIQDVLRETQLSPHNLKLEITETMIMEDEGAAKAILMQLKALGLQIQIDDFGTGYSSLGFLQNFPLNTLKIDRSFIWALDDGSGQHEIVPLIIILAHNLGMNAIAEGVETSEQLQQLRDFKCDFAQGYLFAKPLPTEEVEALLASMRPLSVKVPSGISH